MSTLFAQILPIFTNQTERVATEALRHILQQSEAARNSWSVCCLTPAWRSVPLPGS